MSRNSNEMLVVAEAEASLKGTESLDDPENNGRTDILWGALFYKVKKEAASQYQGNPPI